MSEPFLGEIRLFAGNFAPRGWAFCGGQLLPISQNTALFSIIGTYYGGNGVNTFALPDLRGRVPLHPGQGPGLSPYVIGESSGENSVTLQTSNMPLHTHTLNASNPLPQVSGKDQTGTTIDPSNSLFAEPNVNPRFNKLYSDGIPTETANAAALSGAGGSQPHENRQPYLGLSFIIALQGIFPSRN